MFTFDQIPVKIKAVLDKHESKPANELGDILTADEWARSVI
jgi:1-deoxy-D-xylulose 5-phosphate reductoisomerase